MQIKAFFDAATFTVTYVVADPAAARCAIIDSVLDYDPQAGRTSTESADAVVEFVTANGLTVDWLLETHAHADHLSAAPYLKEQLGGHIAIGEHIVEVQSIFKGIFNAGEVFATDGSQFDRLLSDGDTLAIGGLECTVMHTPGHTPACVTYVIGDAAFVGDTLFMPDYGTARADFPGGDAATLYRSIHKVLALPPATRLFMCHDYLAPGREEYCWETTVADELAHNVHIGNRTSEQAFVAMREARDATLAVPRLLLPAVQVNMRAGYLPPAEDNGIAYLKIPVNAL
ncbi:MAG: MBL fold metallo-hydrolase [Gammaproteobacteria bacterium]|jgi:glyoxylase-like metal-dependent hydrolase (beta-lactamase superfamily II)|nr:MBL fold metallo-hydrolase [Gammaproteobacteria bacterium]